MYSIAWLLSRRQCDPTWLFDTRAALIACQSAQAAESIRHLPQVST